MRQLFKSLAMTALGAAAMYYLDPERGHRRRALMRDRLDLVSQGTSDFVQDQSRWAAAQMKGLAASARRPFLRDSPTLRDAPLRERLAGRLDDWMPSRDEAWDRAGTATAQMSRGTLVGSLLKVVALCAASAAAMYYLDPAIGRRRRALVRDKFDAVSHDARDFARKKSKMTANRLKGLAASATAPFTGRWQPRSERQLRERIRAQLGHLVRHPKAIEVVVNQGNVSLRGQVFASERDMLLSKVLAMPGVKHVDNRLQALDEPSSVPAPQGDGHAAMSGATASRPGRDAGIWH